MSGFIKWTEEVYDSPQPASAVAADTYIMSVQEGGVAVLECTGAGLGHQDVYWLDDVAYISADDCQCYLPNGNLLIRNFSLPSTATVDRVQYKCVVDDGVSSKQKAYLLYIEHLSPRGECLLADERCLVRLFL